ASDIVPVRKKAAPTAGPGGGGGGGGRNAGGDPADASRSQYNALEMRAFANGKRSVLDIRNALAAEYGPIELNRVMDFFKNAEKTGEFELTKRTSASSSPAASR